MIDFVETPLKKIKPERSLMLSAAFLLPERTLTKGANYKKPRTLSPERAREMAELSKKSPNHGKHGKQRKTIAKEEAWRIIQQRLIQRSFKLIDTQSIIAQGTIKVYKITTRMDGKRKVRNPPKLVTNDREIAVAIDIYYNGAEKDMDTTNDDEYVFVTVKDPDHKALQAQLDRAFGKVGQKLEIPKGSTVNVITGMQILSEEDDIGS